MARLPLITSKEQVAPADHSIVDGIIGSRGSLQGPFSYFCIARNWPGGWRIWGRSCGSRGRWIFAFACWPR
jgi:hypothetical protein